MDRRTFVAGLTAGGAALAGVTAREATKVAPPPHRVEETMRVFALGDSLVSGGGSSDGNGWRLTLTDYLHGPNEYRGLVWTGSQPGNLVRVAGTDYQLRHEGHGGYTIGQIIDGVSAGWLSGAAPQIVILQAGDNDLPVHPVSQMVNDYTRLIDLILGFDANIRLVVGNQIPQSGRHSHDRSYNSHKAKLFNRHLPPIIADRPRAVLANHAMIVQQRLDGSGVHPDDFGYRQMAWIIYQALEPWLGWPEEGESTGERAMNNVECPFPFDPFA